MNQIAAAIIWLGSAILAAAAGCIGAFAPHGRTDGAVFLGFLALASGAVGVAVMFDGARLLKNRYSSTSNQPARVASQPQQSA